MIGKAVITATLQLTCGECGARDSYTAVQEETYTGAEATRQAAAVMRKRGWVTDTAIEAEGHPDERLTDRIRCPRCASGLKVENGGAT